MWPADILQSENGCGHPGLFWRYGGQIPDSHAGAPAAAGNGNDTADKEAWRETHVELACRLSKQSALPGTLHGAAYRLAFDRRTAWLQSQGAEPGKDIISVPVEGRLKTGVGEPTVFECQIALHPVTGMPRLLASGLHGLLASWCFGRHQRMPADGDAAKALPREQLVALLGNPYGDDDKQAGALVIHDAWWDPYESKRGPLEPERATNHHPDYYQGGLRAAIDGGHASDFDSPVPSPLIATAGSFQLAISRANIGAEWAQLCMQWLRLALAESGAGASRQLGYGRFEMPLDPAAIQAGGR